MSIEIKAPQFPESVADGTIATWHKKVGETCQRDELLVDIETDKVVLEVVAPADGALAEIKKQEGDTVLSEEVLATFESGAGAASSRDDKGSDKAADDAASGKAGAQGDAEDTDTRHKASGTDSFPLDSEAPMSPAARKLAEEKDVDPARVEGTGKDGRIIKEDVQRAALEQPASASGGHDRQPEAEKPGRESGDAAKESPVTGPDLERVPGVGVDTEDRPARRVAMTRLRASVARRLVEAQQTAAMLTTFNEVNMAPVMELRARHKDQFEKTHNGTRLGFMSFFVKASTEALKRFPAVNASIDGTDIVYHGYYDVGVAVSTERGLVVPVIRDSDGLGLAQIEETIRDFGARARDNKLSLDDMAGGTFTISNGGVFGSLLSTPILNPPQTAILGMHKIQDRPMVVDGKIEILPMMYLALSYDHRLIDGSEAVRFLVTIKELIEDPARILLEI
ncbi:MAG: 2-oxoglutarate dehydrogenase complex dihydrolipoyllysine-residue succinyltransferase [Gammaproteobacteria bacterium]|nr:MAG: 2-oxoglutarate dehydrogenase complex dihydrolipoyllysine-residue succinyltransferase [Gammaproteobacteria bacterium]